ncbi:MobC family plasmid mobilization relaxosome protein [Streptomyces pratensis]
MPAEPAQPDPVMEPPVDASDGSPELPAEVPESKPRGGRPPGAPLRELVEIGRTAGTEQGKLKGNSGFAADVVLAFVDGRFTANLPLSEDRRRTHMFRAQVLRALNRIGSNVNQIARALNSDFTPPDIRQRLDELHRLLTLIAEALRQPTDPREESSA